jgi:hypothetical protein
MPDFSMCKGEGCDSRDKCRRFTATPTPKKQSWIKPDPKNCEFFWAQSTRIKDVVYEIFEKVGEKK